MPRIVFLDPDRDRRQDLKSGLRGRAGVLAVSKIHEALKAINQSNAEVVVVNLELGPGAEMHGLKFAQMVRNADGGETRRLVVFGVPAGKSPSDAKVRQLTANYQVDNYIPENLDGAALAKRLKSLLELKDSSQSKPKRAWWPWRRDKASEVASFNQAEDSDVSMRAVLEKSAVVTAKMQALKPGDETWGDLLKEDVSVDSIRRLFTKDIHFGK